MNYRSIITTFILAAVLLPQLLIQLPKVPEEIKLPDIIAMIAGPVFLILCAIGFRLERLQIATAVVLSYAAGVMLVRIFIEPDSHLYQQNLPQLARLFTLHSMLFLVVAMPNDRQFFAKSVLTFGCIATTASVVMGVLYHFGSTSFNAHQMYQRSGGFVVNRLGGLTGETGAFAFNATIGIQMLLLGLAAQGRSNIFRASLWILFPLYVAFIYHESLVRIAILNSLTFFGLCVVGTNHSSKRARLVVCCVILLVSISLMMVTSAGHTIVNVEVDRISFDGSLDRLSSGRLSNWQEAIELWTGRFDFILLGIGYRMPGAFLGHAVENFFLFHLVTYGVLGTILFFSLYWLLTSRIFKNAFAGDPTSGVFAAVFLSALVQWQVNDVNLFYQTFPGLLFFAAWYTSILCNEEEEELERFSDNKDSDEASSDTNDESCENNYFELDESPTTVRSLTPEAPAESTDDDYWKLPPPQVPNRSKGI